MSKSLHVSYKNLCMSNWVRKNTAKKRHFKYFDKKYESGSDIYLEYKFSEDYSKYMQNTGILLLKQWKKIQKM